MASGSKICLTNHTSPICGAKSLPITTILNSKKNQNSVTKLLQNAQQQQPRLFVASQYKLKSLAPVLAASSGSHVANSYSTRRAYTVGDFMTRKDKLLVVKPTTNVDQALELLVEKRISGFPVIDDDWKLTFNEIQRLLSKTNGKVVGDLMTSSPLVVRESTNLEDAARLLLETKYRRLPVVDGDGKLVGMITRGGVVRAALQMKRANAN